MQHKIKDLRVEIDGLSQLVKELRPVISSPLGVEGYIYENSKEIDKSYDSLLLAKAWLGKVLQELGEPTPYKSDGNRHSKEDIEPTADRTYTNYSEHLEENWQNKNHIEKVDWLRQEIQNITAKLANLDFELPIGTRNHFIWSLRYLYEARFWLGFELQRLKEE